MLLELSLNLNLKVLFCCLKEKASYVCYITLVNFTNMKSTNIVKNTQTLLCNLKTDDLADRGRVI